MGPPPERPPPLPARFFDLYSSAPRIGDDPELHDGRERGTPHQTGRWPTHVFVEWLPPADLADSLERILPADASSLLHSPYGAQLPLHVSLSPPLMLATDDKEPFLESLWEAIDDVSSFTITFTGLRWLTNTAGTREFLALAVTESQELIRLLEQTASVCRSMAYETFSQKNPQLHVSIAWRLPGNAREGSQEEVPVLAQELLDSLRADVDTVKVKIGRVIHRKSL
ncbi:U6 snRNA phosphodiesterase Usb1 [Myxozyma melibiosi]|uniref:U6 snRNA phosphodiesterase 1 n=1 Tax=Myxozyma melibiosi TaxID=54550 RepID=A0ABR1FD80_9ASCO